MIKSFLTTAIRNLLKKKIFTLINILGLVISMTVALFIFNYVTFEKSYDSFHESAERIYRVESRFYDGETMTDDWATSSFGYASAMKEHIPGIEDYVRISIFQTERIVSYEDIKSRESTVVETDSSFLKMFNFKLIEGDEETALSAPNRVLITQSAAYKFFKDQSPIGKVLRFRNQNWDYSCEVTGVIEDLPANSQFDFDYFISWTTLPNWIRDFWYMHEVYSYVKLQPGVIPQKIEAAFSPMAENYKTRQALKELRWGIQLTPMQEVHLAPPKSYELEAKGNQRAINALFIIALAILVIAWINYINLTVSRSLERAREVGIRLVSGAPRYQLFTQFVFESLIINLLAFIIALLLLLFINPFFEAFLTKEIGFALFHNVQYCLVLFFFFVAGVFLTGAYPAFLLTRKKPVVILQGRYIHSPKAGWVRKGLVLFQFLASFILISGTIVLFFQLKYMQTQDLGVDINKTVIIKYPGRTANMEQKLLSFKRELKQLKGVESVSLSNSAPGLEVATCYSNRLQSSDETDSRLFEMLAIDEDYVQLFDLKIIEGRSFSKEYTGDQYSILVNEESVRLLGLSSNKEALNKKVTLEGQSQPYTIVGVVKNYHQQSLNSPYTPIMFLSYRGHPWISYKYIAVKCKSENMLNQLKSYEQCWNDFFPSSTFDYFFSDQNYEKQYKQDQKLNSIFGLFAILTILIACMGLWALAMFAGETRRKELGIRKALGASDYNLFHQLSKEFVQLIIYSSIVALPLAIVVMDRWLSSYAFRTELKWWFFALPFVFLFSLAFLTVSIQTYKTSKSNTMESLKYE